MKKLIDKYPGIYITAITLGALILGGYLESAL